MTNEEMYYLEDLYNLAKRYSAPMFLSIAISVFCEISVTNWKWWAIMIPTIFLYAWKNS